MSPRAAARRRALPAASFVQPRPLHDMRACGMRRAEPRSGIALAPLCAKSLAITDLTSNTNKQCSFARSIPTCFPKANRVHRPSHYCAERIILATFSHHFHSSAFVWSGHPACLKTYGPFSSCLLDQLAAKQQRHTCASVHHRVDAAGFGKNFVRSTNLPVQQIFHT